MPEPSTIPAGVARAERAADELIERLRREYGWYDDSGNGFGTQGYVDALERHVREGLRLNVGLMVEALEAKRRNLEGRRG